VKRNRNGMTDKNLRLQFNMFNKKFFDGKLYGWNVEFKKLKSMLGLCVYDNRTIYILDKLRDLPDVVCVTLLHEMAHAALPDYESYQHFDDHEPLFHAKIHELYMMGAYDGLL